MGRKEKRRRWIIAGALVLIFLFLRCYRLEERMNFSMDQGLFLLRAREIWQKKGVDINRTSSITNS